MLFKSYSASPQNLMNFPNTSFLAHCAGANEQFSTNLLLCKMWMTTIFGGYFLVSKMTSLINFYVNNNSNSNNNNDNNNNNNNNNDERSGHELKMK